MIPAPVGLDILTTAFPGPREQSTVCTGLAGDDGRTGINTFEEAGEVHPARLVTVNE